MNNKEKEIEEMAKELKTIKKELEESKHKNAASLPTDASTDIMRFLVEQREQRDEINRILARITERVRGIEEAIAAMGYNAATPEEIAIANSREVPVSGIDAKILDFVGMQQNSMASADQVREFMKYKGKNAACARLKKLENLDLLKRLQLGHKVYYKYDAGKTTNTLIVSPPQ